MIANEVIIVKKLKALLLFIFAAAVLGAFVHEDTVDVIILLEHNAHDAFYSELEALGLTSDIVVGELHRTMSGVVAELPARYLRAIERFDSVREVRISEKGEIPLTENVREATPAGIYFGRDSMGVNPLHARGITGAGVVVAVIDSGIDWMHPAFAGTFPTIEMMQQRNPYITEADGINIDGTYYFVGRDFINRLAALRTMANPAHGTGRRGNDPMETSPVHFPNSHFMHFTAHGTHVAGTIVGSSDTVRGIAPDALAFHYRITAGRSWDLGLILLAVEQAAQDQPDVVNMSLGIMQASSLDLITVAINNIMLAYPHINFVVSAGNSGPEFMTNTAPAGSSTAITVAALNPAGLGEFSMNVGNEQIALMPLIEHSSSGWHRLDNGRVVDFSPMTRHNDGIKRIFAMPDSGEWYGATGTMNLGLGLGCSDESDMLAETFGADALRGGYMLVMRTNDNDTRSAAAAALMNARRLGMAGVIVVDGTAAGATYIPFAGAHHFEYATGFRVSNEDGLAILSQMTDGMAYFYFTASGVGAPMSVAHFSSRGPTTASFDISPDLGAHGVNVLSSVPRWEVAVVGLEDRNFLDLRWEDVPWDRAYSHSSGTSMAAPHISGAVALMVQYSRQNGLYWTNYEIKTRLMNTAVALDYYGNVYGVFDGARSVNVAAAINAQTVVFAQYPMVTTIPGERWDYQFFGETVKGSFSFGLVARGYSSTLYMSIESTQGRTYEIRHEFNTSGRNARAGGALDHQGSVTVGADGRASLPVTIHIPHDAVELGHYMGYITVYHEGNVVARLPFGAVGFDNTTAVTNIFLYRPVITSYANMLRGVRESRELHIFFTPHRGFRMDAFIYRKAPGEASFARAQANAWRMATAQNLGLENLGYQHRGAIMLNPFMRNDAALPYTGDFQLRITIYAEVNPVFDPNPEGNPRGVPIFIYQETVILPFFIDNTPPKISDVSVEIIGNAAIVTGRVYDEWMNQAIDKGVTFDIWAIEPRITLERNLGVWVGGTRAAVDAGGTFTAIIPNTTGYITIWAIDNYSPIPMTDRPIGAPTPDATNRAGQTHAHFTPNGFTLAGLSLPLHTGLVWSPTARPLPENILALQNYFVWMGTNITEYVIFIP